MMTFRKISLTGHTAWGFLAGGALVLQGLMVLLLKNQLGDKLPTYFSFTGRIIGWFAYQRPIILPGILFLAALHLAGLLLGNTIPVLLNRMPLLGKYLPDSYYLGGLAFAWFEALTWPVLGDFFGNDFWTAPLILVINSVWLLIVVFKTGQKAMA
ncbi:MAG TPA: hypothetical protein H9875_06455 [Candidatus Levilactobacillus faecigallinarum]|uniref:Uncharacterized protein n=1 Tax=Candidatus Levilactobacillus faecigallinarum TaxID=2838638 RepID=A0A9D1U6A7_9LACO|nr:hypothetical protein [Candidatus Levilactobacillus faecigallinarum]